jgi:hypothetical protein
MGPGARRTYRNHLIWRGEPPLYEARACGAIRRSGSDWRENITTQRKEMDHA